MDIEAVVFDFDGVLVETEEPEYLAWRQIWSEAGLDLMLDEWCAAIGTVPELGGFDPYLELVSRSGQTFDQEEVLARRRALAARVTGTLPLRPGIDFWVKEAVGLGLKTAIASSSTRRWVAGHLDRLGIGGEWPHLVCFDDCGAAKPDPTSYREACRLLGVDPRAALAVEDSRHGLTAAKSAGLRTVAVPTKMTAGMDFSDADLVVLDPEAKTLGEVLAQL